jgi:2-polyprenyl-3-methyl-5-hydroxy-6-metoxy-1,4-benzoquinol methylase
VNSKNLYVDPFDEVPVNRFRDINQMNVVYTQNAAAIHIIYNSIPNNDLYEKNFMHKMFGVTDMNSFEETLKKYEAVDTKKGTDKNTSHSYGSVYSKCFKEFQEKKLNLLEIGFDCGASLLAYADYFQDASIDGLDIEDNRLQEVKEHPRIRTHIEDALQSKNYFGCNYDIIIEDASHEPAHQIQHFIDFAKFVKPGGLYIIEDVNQNYFPDVVSGIRDHAKSLGFSLDVKDLRGIKGRFDDILIMLKRNLN